MAHKLSLPTMVSYGFGQVGEAIKNTGFNTFLLFYYNQVLEVSATGTSLVLAIALIFDAVSDPVAGSLSDKLQSRWGRRHPFIFISAFPLAISFFFLFHPPDGLGELGTLVWLCIFAVLVRGSMTFYHVPHLALGAEMAEDYNQRSTLFAFNTLFQFTGAAIFLPLSYRFFFPTSEAFNPALLNQAAYTPWAIFAGFFIIVAILICVLGTASEIPRLREKTVHSVHQFGVRKLLRELADIFRNTSFRACFFGMVLVIFILAVEGVFNPFMGFHFWGMTTEQLTYLPLGQLTGLMLSVALVPLLTRSFDKKPVLIVCSLLTIVNINTPIVITLLGFDWFPEPGSTGLLMILVVNYGLTALLAPIVFATINSMYADIADEHELETGERREGVIYAARSFANKAAASFGLIFGGLLIDFIAFPRGASLGSVPEETVWQLGFIAGPATSVFTIAGVLLFFKYRIDRSRHSEILSDLSKR